MAARYAQDGSQSPVSPSSGPIKRARSGAENDTVATAGSKNHPRPKRAQVPRACHRCKRLQKGCSEQRPCQRCVRADLADACVDPPPPFLDETGFRSRGIVAYTSPGPATGPLPLVGFPLDAHARHLPPPDVVDLCLCRFFAELCPTIPILTEDYGRSLRFRAGSPESGYESCGALVGLCALVLLLVEDPERSSFGGIIRESNAVYGRQLLDEAIAIHQRVRQRSNPSFDQVLLTFFLYACHASLFHHSRAFFFLREATTLFLLFRPENEDPGTGALAQRLFWVLLISERSHAIRYRRPVTLQVTPDTPAADRDPLLTGFWDLAALFRPLDTSFIALLNQENLACPPSAASLASVETAINRAVDHGAELLDTQKANLRVTQLWLRIILWQLRLHLGHLSEDALPLSLTYHYPLEVGKDATLSTRDLPLESMRVHGVGLTEKLFDIACAVVDVLARIPLTQTDKHGIGGRPEDNLRYLRRMIALLPGGEAIYDDLLLKHVQQTLPGMTF